MAKLQKVEIKNDEGMVEARPQYEGKDPLAEGNSLANPSNSEAETHYEVIERSEDAQNSETAFRVAHQRVEQHNAQVSYPAIPASKIRNGTKEQQEAVAVGRVEPIKRK